MALLNTHRMHLILRKNFVKSTKLLYCARRWFHEIFQVRNHRNSLTHFWQKFREVNSFTKEVTKELISRNIFLVRENFSFFHTVLSKLLRCKIACLLKISRVSNWDHKDSSGRITFYQIEIQCVPLEKLLCMFYFVTISNFRNVSKFYKFYTFSTKK